LTKYVYTGEQEIVFPSLGVVVNKGDVFDAPAGLVVANVSISSKALGSSDLDSSASVSDVSVEQTTTTDVSVETNEVPQPETVPADVADQTA